MFLKADISTLLFYAKSRVEARRELAIRLYYGFNAPDDEKEAKIQCEKAKNAGDKIAKAFWFFQGWNDRFRATDYKAAFRLCQDKECVDHPQIQVIIGWIHSSGQIGPENKQEALHWYLKAATEHNYALAQANLASIYKKDPKTVDKALELYKKASAQGHLCATLPLANLLEEKGLYKEACEYYIKLFVLQNELALKAQTAFINLIKTNKIAWSPEYHRLWPELPQFKSTIVLLMWIKKVDSKIKLPRPLYYEIIRNLFDILK